MKSTLLAFFVLVSVSAFASDSWESCSSADGYFVTNRGELVSPEKNEEENYVMGKLLKEVKIKQVTETCRIKGTNQKVTSLDNLFSFKVYEMNVGESKFIKEFLCEEGGSGLPAIAECDETTVKKTTKYFVK